jgi:hypothetical protein
MKNGVEGGPREPLVAAASPICPKCKAYFRFTETFLDVRRNLIVRFFDANAGRSSGTKDQHKRTNGALFIPVKIRSGVGTTPAAAYDYCSICQLLLNSPPPLRPT